MKSSSFFRVPLDSDNLLQPSVCRDNRIWTNRHNLDLWWMRNVLFICLMDINILCRTWATSIFTGAGTQNRDQLNHAGTPGSTKFLFPLHENHERRGTAEYQTCIKFSLILWSKCSYTESLDDWALGALFSLQAFLFGEAGKEIHMQDKKTPKVSTSLSFFPGTGNWLRVQ